MPRRWLGTLAATFTGAVVAFVFTVAGFWVVINNQAWPKGGHAVRTSRPLFILALLPFWLVAAFATMALTSRVASQLGGSKTFGVSVNAVFLALLMAVHIAVLLTWKN